MRPILRGRRAWTRTCAHLLFLSVNQVCDGTVAHRDPNSPGERVWPAEGKHRNGTNCAGTWNAAPRRRFGIASPAISRAARRLRRSAAPGTPNQSPAPASPMVHVEPRSKQILINQQSREAPGRDQSQFRKSRHREPAKRSAGRQVYRHRRCSFGRSNLARQGSNFGPRLLDLVA